MSPKPNNPKPTAKKPNGKPAAKSPSTGLKPKQRVFLLAYSLCGSLRAAAKATGIERKSHWLWNNKPGAAGDAYRCAFAEAVEESNERLEEEARHRAVEGERDYAINGGEPVFCWFLNGEVVPEGTAGAERRALYKLKKSDQLLITLLKANLPDKYGDKSAINLTTNAIQPLDVVIAECLAAIEGKENPTDETEPATPGK